MISFRFKNQIKKVKIKTKQKLDERMSNWLQKVFSFKNQIIGFKSQDNKFYDVQSFYTNIQKFFTTNQNNLIDIIEAGDQLEISFTSDNLNSSSFIRPSQPSQINHKQIESDQFQDFTFVNDRKSFEKKLIDGKDITLLFDVNVIYKKTLLENSENLLNQNYQFKINLFMYINNSHPKKSCLTIYIGKICIITFPLLKNYQEKLKQFFVRYKSSTILSQRENKLFLQARASHQYQQQEDEAPSFTTYHLQQRLTQETCLDYLAKMHKQKFLKNYQYHKLLEKCDENFNQFYRIFCEGIMDNDYESFKNQLLHKVDNNLEIILSNVDQMDLSRPISRQQQRRNNLKKSVPQIQIVKVQNYFEILDQFKNQFNHQSMNQIKKLLLDEDKQIFNYFSEYLSRQINQQTLAFKLHNFLEKRPNQYGSVLSNTNPKSRPVSRYIPSRPIKSYSVYVDPVLKRKYSQQKDQDQIRFSNNNIIVGNSNFNQNYQTHTQEKQTKLLTVQNNNDSLNNLNNINNNNNIKHDRQTNNNDNHNQLNINNIEQPPMFGSVKNQQNFSPIKYMSDIQSNYKQAYNKLSQKQKCDLFESQQYGLLYFYLQKRDDSISNYIQQLQWAQYSQDSIKGIKKFLKDKMQVILSQNFTQAQINYIQSMKNTSSFNFIYENFRFQSDLSTFISCLKKQLQISKPYLIQTKKLHKKSSDSQLLDNKQKKNNRFGKRKFSDQNQIVLIGGVSSPSPRSGSPKQSQYSLYNKQTQKVYQLLDTIKIQWKGEFDQMLKDINFTEEKKEQAIRDMYKNGNPKIFGWIRNYMKGHQQFFSSQDIHDLKNNHQEIQFIISISPIFNEFLKLFVEDGLISQKMRKWLLVELVESNMTIVAAFELFLQTKQEQDFIQTLILIYEKHNTDMEFYNTYVKRLQGLLREMSVNDEVGLQVFQQFPKAIKSICQLYFLTGNLQDMMDTLQILYKKQRQLREIKAVTLNFSKTILNMFQFQNQANKQEIQKLNSRFVLNLQRLNISLDKQWKIGSIDQILRNQKQNHFFKYFVFTKDRKLPNKQQIESLWKNRIIKNNKNQLNLKQQQIKQFIELNYLIYITLVQHLYEIQSLLELQIQKQNQKLKTLNSSKLLQYLNDIKNKSQFKLDKKQQIVMKYLLENNIDILFLQQAGQIDWKEELVKQYTWVKNNNQVIIYKKEKIGNIKENNAKNIKNINNQKKNVNCVEFYSDKHFLLYSILINQEDIEQTKKTLIQISQNIQKQIIIHPMLKVIIGISLKNTFKYTDHQQSNIQLLISHICLQKLKLVPYQDNIPTILQKRTHLQFNQLLAAKQISSVEDFIITNRNIVKWRIQNIEGIQIKSQTKQFLPNQRHPYNHFIVRSQII